MSAEAQQRESKILVEYAAKAAEQFVSLYYSAYDSKNRVGLVPTLYLPTSTVVWNGNPIPGAAGVAELMGGLPATKHEVQALDAQPMGGGTRDGVFAAPSLLVTVTGVVTSHTPDSASALPPSNAPQSSSRPRKGNGQGVDPSLPLESLPRAFSQNFVLVNDPEGKGDGGVLVSWDASASAAAAAAAAAAGKRSQHHGGHAAGNNNKNGTGDGEPSPAMMVHGRFFVQADHLRFVG
ncbi:unnamed protein product [Parajaminaea phylloscopi]